MGVIGPMGPAAKECAWKEGAETGINTGAGSTETERTDSGGVGSWRGNGKGAPRPAASSVSPALGPKSTGY